jgi:hypothetical protein
MSNETAAVDTGFLLEVTFPTTSTLDTTSLPKALPMDEERDRGFSRPIGPTNQETPQVKEGAAG